MKLCIYYYSGAGNTECISQIIEHVAQTQGYSVYRRRITVKSIATIDEDYDILAIGYPVYFRQAPQMVRDFINRQAGHNKKFFIFCTKGLYSGNASRELQVLATKQSFRYIGNLEFYMPGSDALALMAKKDSFAEKFFKSIHSKNIKTRIEKFIRSINDHAETKEIPAKWYTPIERRIVKPLEQRFTNNYQIFIGRFAADTASCNLCLHCVKGCPNANISVADRTIQFGSNCSLCLRCLHHCPQEAINIKKATENTVRYRPQVTKDLSIIFDNN